MKIADASIGNFHANPCGPELQVKQALDLQEKMSRQKIVFLRHGPKSGESLDIKKTSAFVLVASKLVQEFGSAFAIVSSNVQRSVDSGLLLEKCLRKTKEGVVVTTLPSRPEIGFTVASQYKNYFTELQTLFAGNEFDIGSVWVSRKHERQRLIKHIGNRYGSALISDLEPKRFIETPEAKTIEHIGIIEELKAVSESGTILVIGHVPRIDFLHVAVESGKLSYENYSELGVCRDFLEYSSYEIEDSTIVKSKYRGKEKAIVKSLKELRNLMMEEMKSRIDEWNEV